MAPPDGAEKKLERACRLTTNLPPIRNAFTLLKI